ncbi:MAG: PilN domain-containing protein [Deltaproteobacteria bacterium]|nr:PilN domain-containing protein [Deltaproteobacteria bacterium]
MIQRINLIERERFKVTYGTLSIVLGISIFFCASLYGVLLISEMRASSRMKLLTADIDRLKIEREQLIAKEDIGQSSGPVFEIRTALKKTIPWSQILNDIVLSLPPNVWLVSFKSFDKQESPSKKGVLLNGTAKNPQVLSNFLAAMEETSHFEKVILTSSKEEGGSFNFSITCDISAVAFH